MLKKQVAVEIHTHTNHSDGAFTVEELIKAAKDFGYKGLALTDHNTSSGYQEIVEKNLSVDEDLTVLKGMEWTTYFGHLLVHGANYDVDWRDSTVDNIDAQLKKIKDADGLTGIAHPYDIGSPICTGCHWEYDIKNYDLIDYIEIWNSNNPHEKLASQKAYETWIDLLNQGYRISCSAGRDWHREDEGEFLVGISYLETNNEKLSATSFKESLKAGNFYITLGPKLEIVLKSEKEEAFIGDEIDSDKKWNLQVTLHPSEIGWLKNDDLNQLELRVWNNGKKIHSVKIPDRLENTWSFEVDNLILDQGYLRVDVISNVDNKSLTPLILGNPVYIINKAL